MPGANAQPEVGGSASNQLPSVDTVLRGIPALKKLPPVVAYLIVSLLTVAGGYFGQGVHGVSAADAKQRDNVIIEKLETIDDGLHDLDRRLIKIEALREAERDDNG